MSIGSIPLLSQYRETSQNQCSRPSFLVMVFPEGTSGVMRKECRAARRNTTSPRCGQSMIMNYRNIRPTCSISVAKQESQDYLEIKSGSWSRIFFNNFSVATYLIVHGSISTRTTVITLTYLRGGDLPGRIFFLISFWLASDLRDSCHETSRSASSPG